MDTVYYQYRHPYNNKALYIAIVLSILLHFSFLTLSHAPFEKREIEKIKVKYIDAPKEKVKNDVPSQIVETAKPLKEEKPLTEKLLSEFDAKGHQKDGKKSDVSETIKTAVPMNKPKGVEKQQIQKSQPVKEEKKVETKKEEKPLITNKPTLYEKKEIKKVEEKKEEKKKESLVMAKNSINQPKGTKNSALLSKELPILDGADLAQYASVNKGNEDLSDSDTISLDTENYKYISYFNHLKRKIELVWNYPKEAAMQGASGKLQLKFTLQKDGKLLKVVLLSSTGYTVLDNAAIEALKKASPYNPFPETINKEKINIIANFVYFPSYQLLRGR
ncbi:MAG: energy transducer TonB [Nitrospinae bacterium]|nr:energy transducer TonB [Nitrospinota bacterium]